MPRGLAALLVAGIAGCASAPAAGPAPEARAAVDTCVADGGPSAAFIGGPSAASLPAVEWRGPRAEYECPRTGQRWTLPATAPLRCRSCTTGPGCSPTLLGLLPAEIEGGAVTVPVGDTLAGAPPNG